jgi:large subunit ribosomal protein L7/L12
MVEENKENTQPKAEVKDLPAQAGEAPTPAVEEKKPVSTDVSQGGEEKKDAPTPQDEGRSPDSSKGVKDVGIEVPSKFKKLIEEIEKMTVLELHELVKVLEEKFGVSAAAVAVVAPGAVAASEAGEEQDSFTVELKSAGDQKIAIIKAIKGILGLGLKEAKDMADGAPVVLKEGVKKEEAEEIKKKIEDAGGVAELK